MAAAVGPVAGDQRLPRERRVRRRSEYLAIQGQGRRLMGAHYILMARPAPKPGDPPRFGITVSRKVGGAVSRNLVKRWVRECCRRMQRDFPRGLDLVVVARPSAATAGYEPTARDLASLARRLRGR
jgi:ribonuclease P protein component